MHIAQQISTSLRHHRRTWRIFFGFFGVAWLIVLLHLLFHPVRMFGMDTSIFYMDEKYTLSSFFTTTVAFLISFISFVFVYPQKRTVLQRVIEIGYGAFFFFLSLDEYVEIHEYINTLIKTQFHKGELVGLLANTSWIFPLSIVIGIVFLLLFVKIYQAVPICRMSAIAGCLAFACVLCFELLGSVSYGLPIYIWFVAFEEGMEMVGISLFLLTSLMEMKLTGEKMTS